MRKPEAWLRVAAVADEMAEAVEDATSVFWIKIIREWYEELRQACAEAQARNKSQ